MATRTKSLTEEKKFANHGECGKVAVKDDEAFEVKQTPLFCNRRPGHYQQDLRRKMLNHKSFVVRAAYF